MVGETRAPDVVQDAFVQAWRGLAGLRDPDRFVPWLHRIAANRARSMLRADGRIREIGIDAVIEYDLPVLDDAFVAAEARTVVEAAFRRLSIDHRTVIALHYGAGLSLRDVAVALDIPVGTAKSRLSAALTALRFDVEGPRP
jgi:RNA polymerase sigma-70 factor (ECF subfamily)